MLKLTKRETTLGNWLWWKISLEQPLLRLLQKLKSLRLIEMLLRGSWDLLKKYWREMLRNTKNLLKN